MSDNLLTKNISWLKPLVLTICLILSACARPPEARQTAIENWLSTFGGLKISRPSLSPDGKLMAFDFQEMYTRGKGVIRKRQVLIGIYEFDTGKIEIIAPYGEKIGFHNPSFDRTGKHLVMVSHCHTAGCRPNWYGSQIATYDIEKKSVSRITSSTDNVEMWFYQFGKRGAYLGTPAGDAIVRGRPTFSLTNDDIYYVTSSIASGSTIFGNQFSARFRLRRLRPIVVEGETKWVDEKAISTNESAVLFKGAGKLSPISDGRILMSAAQPLGKQTKILEKQEVSAFFYDEKTEKLSIAFDNSNSPLTKSVKAGVLSTHTNHHSVSPDGKTYFLLSHGYKIVSIVEDGEFRDFIKASDLNVEKMTYLVTSQDGKWLVVFPSDLLAKKRTDTIWRFNIRTGKRDAVELRTLLQRAIKQKINRTGIAPK